MTVLFSSNTIFFFFSSRRRHTRCGRDWSSDVCSSDLYDLIVSYRQSPGPAEVFQRLPKLVAFVRCAIDIRNIDVAAASKAGVLVTQASAGFVASVAEMVLGFMVDLSRGITRSTMDYRAGRVPKAAMGKELRGSTLGIIGYGAIGRGGSRIGKALGMRGLVNDPYVKDVEQTSFDELLRQSDYVVPLASATGETENLMNSAAFAKMKTNAFFINVSRGNLVRSEERRVGKECRSRW